jgi:small-conductance mechanosensitive channel
VATESLTQLLSRVIFQFHGATITLLGLIALLVCAAIGAALAAFLQGDLTSRLLKGIGLDHRFFSIVRFALSVFFLIGFLLLGLNLAGVAVPWEERIPGVNLSAGQILRIVLFIFLALWASSVIKHQLVSRVLSRSGLEQSLQYAIAQITGYIVLAIGFLLTLQSTGIDLSTVTVFAGAVGVGVGLGLQSLASNFISGLVILAERPIKIGDRIEVAGVAGQVTDIRARSTTVITNDNISLIVPNSIFTEHTVTNWSHGDQKVRFRIPVSVAYGSDLGKVKEALMQVAKRHPSVLTAPEPTVFFDSFGDSALRLELVVWSAEMSYRPRRFRSDLNFAIDQALRDFGIELPFPQRDLNIRGGTIRVKHVDDRASNHDNRPGLP